jgi:hypothetical protein
MKNNRDLENIMFNIISKKYEKFIYNDATFLLVLAIANSALFRYETLDDL